GGPQERFEGATEVIEVELPVHVVAGGEPVRGLTAEDFEVYEGKRRKRITGFEVIDLALYERGGPQLGEDLPPAARRHILLLFDLTFARPASIVKAREAARELVLEKLHPGDLVAVATYAVRHGTSLVLGFTPDRRQVEAAIDSLGLPQLVERVNDPLGLMFTTIEPRDFADGIDAASGAPPPIGSGGAQARRELRVRSQTLEMLDILKNLGIRQQLLERDVQRNLAVSFTQGLGALGRLLAGVEGEKHVILLSEGFDSSLLLGTGEREEIEQQANAAASGELWNVDSERRFGSTAALQVIEQMADAFRRSNATVHTVDIGGLRAGGETAGDTPGFAPTRSSEDSLFVIADSTGGELFRNFNDLGAALGRLVEQTGVTYLLSFEPGDLELDGSFHPIEVRLKGGPRGARVMHRPGYYAPKPAALQHPVERRLTAADLVLRASDSGPIASSVLAAPWARSGAGGDGGAAAVFVPVLVEIDGEDLLAGRTEGLASIELYGYAFDQDGRVGDFFSQSLALDVGRLRGDLLREGLKFYGHLDLLPGDYSLRVLLQDQTMGRWSFRRLELRVPGAPADGGPGTLALLFPERAERRLLVRQHVGEGGAEPAYPFVVGGETFVPAIHAVVSRGGVTGFYLGTSEALAGPVSVDAWVTSADGVRIETPTVTVAELPEAGAPGPALLAARLEPGGLAAGEYVLTVSLAPGQGGSPTVGSIPITVVAGESR
ncbi:MAG TPA: VWA domain-containing protein, partial [Thermoanaerobaculia bacterium]|nr:VWA domain-containing protein [Thermoanaerobaculia bacterium]